MAKFNQKISAEMQRFKDNKGNYYLDSKYECFMVRNKTRIKFGHEGKLMGIEGVLYE